MERYDVLISVIVPVYNVEQYIHTCLDSILNQTFTGFELICIDDGSTDGSGAIIDEYATRDPRIRVIHKANGGVSSARNVGLEVCKGKFVVFIDSDDYVKDNYLSDLLQAYNEHNTAEVLVISHYMELGTNGILDNHHEDTLILLDAGSAFEYETLVSSYAIYGPYCKLYHKEVINRLKLKYDESLTSAEDFDFNIRYIQAIKSIRMIANSQYVYRVGYKKVHLRFIDQSAVKSAHIISAGLIQLASRMGIYEEVKRCIAEMVAEKHWLNRVPMVFAPDSAISFRERKEMYVALRGDDQYRDLCRCGLPYLHISSVTKLLAKIDCCELWYICLALKRFLQSFKH